MEGKGGTREGEMGAREQGRNNKKRREEQRKERRKGES